MNRTQSGNVSGPWYFFYAGLCLAITFAWLEPSGAAGLGFLRGLPFWLLQMSVVIPLLLFAQSVLTEKIADTEYSPWLLTLWSALLGATAFVPFAYLFDIVFEVPEDHPNLTLVGGLLDEACGVIPPVVVTWLGLNAPWILQLSFAEPAWEHSNDEYSTVIHSTEHDCSVQSPGPAGFLNRVQQHLAGELVSISSELHYLRVVTTEGQVLILHSMKDAIENLPSNFGIQIHRSHYVATTQIKDLRRTKNGLVCVLRNGTSLPVSRRRQSEVKRQIAESRGQDHPNCSRHSTISGKSFE